MLTIENHKFVYETKLVIDKVSWNFYQIIDKVMLIYGKFYKDLFIITMFMGQNLVFIMYLGVGANIGPLINSL